MRLPLRHLLLPVVAAGVLVAGSVSPASAHSLQSSTLSVHVGADSVDATVSVALEALDAALGTGYAATADVGAAADEAIAYLAEHVDAPVRATRVTTAPTRRRRCGPANVIPGASP